MGKKKRSGGGGRRNKGRNIKDHHAGSGIGYDNDLLNEEITALCAIFQDDCKVISDSPPQLVIKLRPYSKDTGYEDIDVSALLLVRFLPGYPYKCPKLQITPEKGLCEEDTDNLLSLLHDQASSNAREGRVMIYNLVETAQEFLSEIVPVGHSHEPVSSSISDGNVQSFQKDMGISCNETVSPRGPFIYGFIDLFAGLGESWHWDIQMDDNRGINSSHSHTLNSLKAESRIQQKKIDENEKAPTTQNTKYGPSPKLYTLEEDIEDENKTISSTDSSTSLVDDLEENDSNGEKEEVFSVDRLAEDDDSELEGESSESLSDASSIHTHASQNLERDLVMVHLLRLACASKGALTDALPVVSTELYNLGILSDWVRDLAMKPSSFFNKTFDNVFRQHRNSSKISQFWIPASDAGGQSTQLPNSRYNNDFEELQPLGHGGFGHVVLCKNKIDGRQYAVKKIRLRDKTPSDRILREVATLSRLQHQHVVRYYQAWFETGIVGVDADSTWDSKTAGSSFSNRVTSSADVMGHDNQLESTYLYIQMEYCPRTLRQVFELYSHFDKELAWHLFRQIVEGLAHIHGHGIIHRDLTPNNIFFDARNDIKIGDFGLAKFLKLEQLDQDTGFPIDTTGVSVDGTGQVGTYFYTAPEIEQRWPKIDEKADMYSLGVVFFELWHPFGTAMERHIILSDLKQKGELPTPWVAEFPEQASLLQHMMSPSPSDRPSATELLQHAFPPRMEHELVDNILRTMRSSEDTSIYDRVVNAIFDDELLSMRDRNQRIGRLHSLTNDTSSIQCTDLDTELRDHVIDVTREEFRQHCAKHLEILPMHLLDDNLQFNRNSVKLLTHGGDMIELCHELRLPFVKWVIRNQKTSVKQFEISYVHRRAIGHSTPNRYLQGDFDIIGGASALTEAEVIKVAMDTLTHFFHWDVCDIHLNHGDLLDAIWSWIGIKPDHRQKVAELLSMMGSLRPQSSERKSKWVLIRRQLQQELGLGEAVVNRLQTVGLRFCGPADQALPRLRGALPSDKLVRKALHELSDLCSYLRVWKIEKRVYIDALMTPTEIYHRELFFQIYLMKESSSGTLTDGVLLAVGGRYDFLLHQMSDCENKSNAPGGVGSSLALETVIHHSSVEIKPFRSEASISVLVCSRGGGGLLEERMDLTAELWDKNIKAQFVPINDPSLTQQYEYANEHDIKCLIIITDAGVSQTGFLKVRHLELKKEKEVERGNLVKFLLEATVSQFRNPSIWN